MDLVWFPISVL